MAKNIDPIYQTGINSMLDEADKLAKEIAKKEKELAGLQNAKTAGEGKDDDEVWQELHTDLDAKITSLERYVSNQKFRLIKMKESTLKAIETARGA